MREILFRGKTESGEFAEGYYVETLRYNNLHWIWNGKEYVTVAPSTVGQFTGLTDKNGKRIFEGDIIKSDNGKQAAISVVKFGEYYPNMFYKMFDVLFPGRKHLPAVGFYGKTVDKGEEIMLFQSQFVTVIGNIHDNPELMEVSE